MNAVEPAVIILATYFQPRRRCTACGCCDARTACGSSFCVTCWESINDDLITQAAEEELL